MADDDQTALAEDRTDLAEDRTVLAHERSFAGWVRTGMASVGVGLGFNAFFETLKSPWIPKAIATAFLAIAIFIFLSAERRACRALEGLDSHKIAKMKPVRIRLVSWALIWTTAALGCAMWLLVRD